MIREYVFNKSKAENVSKVKIVAPIFCDGRIYQDFIWPKFWNKYLYVAKNLGMGAGYPCFVISIAMIGLCTAVIGDVAGHLGCFIYLKDSVNAIAFVALGTSVPGTKICYL